MFKPGGLLLSIWGSAGVYLRSDLYPCGGDSIDPKSRHRGKHDLLEPDRIAVYLDSPTTVSMVHQSYNELEAGFLINCARRPIPIPGNSLHITQLGHVKDLAGNVSSFWVSSQAIGQIYIMCQAIATSRWFVISISMKLLVNHLKQCRLSHYRLISLIS